MMHRDKEKWNAYIREYQKEKYVQRKDMYLEKLGGKCVLCDSTESLEFDHIDATTKSFTFTTKIATLSIEKLDAEAEKLQLLCNKCHKEKTAASSDDGSVGHGQGNSGKRNCPCAPCKAKKAEYMKSKQKQYNSVRDEKRKLGLIK
jgi:5-methylcytosine-specific restriction endonuclease McrA